MGEEPVTILSVSPEFCFVLYQAKVFEAVGGRTSKLDCGHQVGLALMLEQCRSAKEKCPKGPLQVRCKEPQCFHVLSEKELREILKEYYTTFVSGEDVSSYTQIFP